MARDPEETDISKGKLIKEYPLNSYSLFLPEIGGQYPSGGSYDVVQSLSLPSTRDILAQLGSINATDPEDSAPVYAKLGDLRKFIYYFKIFVDVENAIAESSETNVFWFGDSFYIVPTSPYDGVSQSTTYTTTFGQFIGDAAFGSFFVGDPALNGTDTSDKRFAARVRDYALYRAPFSNTQRIIISPVRDSGAISLTAAGGFLTSTADFFSATDVGKYLKINNTEFPITSFSNNTVDVATTATTQLGDVISLGATGPSSVLKTGGAVTFSVSNGLLTSSEDFFESTHQGHYFRTDSGDVYNIQSINLAYVNQPTTVAASTGTIRKSSDLSLIRSSVFINVKAENGTLTSSQSFFTEDDVGELFRMDTGEIFHIKSYVNSTSVNITTTAIASPGRIINATTLIEEGDSGSIEVTATNGKLTSDAALFNTTHVGKIFQMDTGEAFYIASYTPVSVNTITTTFESTGKILDPDTYAEIRSSGTTKITASNGTLSSDGVFFTDDDLGRVFRMDNGDMDMFTIKSIPRTRVTTSNTTSAGPATGEIYIKESSSNSGHSGNIRITASGSQLTAESAFFSDEDIGKIFRMDSGEVFNINAFTSSTSVSISETLASAGPSAGALYDFGTPNLLFGDDVQNAVKTDLNIKGFEDKPFLTISFDFNILAEDVAIDVQRTEDSGTTWSTILSIEPPYIGTSGTSSLTGYLGLLDNPYVFAVEGNNTDVQKTYAARVSVRDQIPYDSTSTSQRLKLSVRSLVSKPAELTVLSPSAGFAATSGEAGVLLDWSNNGANPSTGGDYVYLIERKGGTTTDYKILGWSFSPSYYDKSAAELITYTYRVKAVSSGGATAYLPEVTGIW
jgi:hypothetical protein